MRIKFYFFRSLAVFIFMTAFFVTSCKEKASKVKLEEAQVEDIDEINNVVLTSDSSSAALPTTGAKGETWVAWDNVFNACFKNETFKKNKIYLGPANPKYLGTILSKNKITTRRELSYIIPPSEFSKFTTTGIPVNNCDLTSVRDFSMDLVLGATISKMDESLKLAISNYDSTKITGGQWQIDELRVDDFLDYINSSTDPKILGYKKSLLENKNMVITKVVKVSGFKAEIYSSRSISGELEANLSIGKTLQVITPDSTNNNNDFKVTLGLSKTKTNTVSISSNGVFYVYGMVLRGSKL